MTDWKVDKNVERPATIGVGRAERLDKCPRSLYLDLLYDRGTQSHAMARGSIFHEMAEQATNDMIANGEAYVPGEVARDLVTHLIAESGMVIPEHEQDYCRGLAFNWGDHHSATIDRDTLVANERLLMVEIGGWKIRGRIDRGHVLNSDCWIFDYKTGKHIPNSEDLIKDFQLKVYALLMGEGVTVDNEGTVLEEKPPAAGANRFWPTLVFPHKVHDESNECVTRSPMLEGGLVPFKRENFHDLRGSIENSLKALDKGLEEGIWPASPGSHCSRCVSQKSCPIPEELRDFDQVETLEEATELAELHDRTDELQKRRYAAIKGFAKEREEAVPVGDLSWDFDTSFATSPRNRKQFNELRDAGQPIPADLYVTRPQSRFSKKKRTPATD